MTNLLEWNKSNILKFSIDHIKIEENLTDFPVLLNITQAAGINGYDCSSFFDELEYPDFTTATFTGINGDQPDPILWTASSLKKVYIYENKLTISGTSSEYVTSNFALSGNFDIQVDIDYTNNPSTNSWAAQLIVNWVSGTYTNSVSIYKGYTSSTLKCVSDYSINGSSAVINNINNSTNPSKLRITRAASVAYFYFWENSAWVSMGNYTIGTADIKIKINGNRWDSNPNATIYFNNFIINEGTIIWPTTKHPNCKKIALVYPSVQESWEEEYDNQTVLLIQSIDQPINSTVFNDSSKYKNIVTSYANAYHSGLQAKFGTSSMYFNGIDSYIQIPYSDLFSISQTTDYTIEFWLYLISSSGTRTILGKNAGSGTGSYSISAQPNSIGLTVSLDGTGGNSSTGGATTTTSLLNSWHHIAFVFKNSTLKIFQNGTQIGTDWAIPTFNVGTAPLNIGQLGYPGYNYWTNCYLEDICFTKYVARYTENFDPPIAPIEPEIIYKSYIHKENEQLFCEIENFDQINKSAQLWVKIPKVLTKQPTDILLYFDKTQQNNNTYIGTIGDISAQKVWDENFVGVYHMNQDPSVGGACILDSTKNKLHGTPSASVSSVDADIGKALYFSGAYVVLPDSILLRPSEITLATQVKLMTCTNHSRIFDRSAFSLSKGYAITTSVNTSLCFETRSTGGTAYYVTNGGISIANDNSWHTFTGSYKNGLTSSYFDGVNKQNTITNTVLSDASTDNTSPRIGDGLYDANMTGYVARLQISNISRSKAWCIANEYSIKDYLITITTAPIYQISGYVTEKDVPVQRTVYLYDRASGELMDKCISNNLGYYSLKTTVSGPHNVVCLDAVDGIPYDDLMLCKVIPTEVV